jgi:uncharacterized protein (TIGR03437 family)
MMIPAVLLVTLLWQPGIGQNGVVNTASQIPPTLPGGAIARGALFTIHGVRLTSPKAGATVTLSGFPLKIISQSPRKLEALMATSAPLGKGALVVTVDGMVSKPFPMEVAAFNPGIFTANGAGWGPALIDGKSQEKPARPGQKVSLLTTGIGGANEVSVVVGNRTGKGVAVRGSRAGEDRIIFQIPPDAPSGCWVPLYLLAAPNRASNVATISIRRDSGRCDPGPVRLWSEQRTIGVALSRTRLKASKAGQPDSVSDEASIAVRTPMKERTPNLHDLLPPPGTCITSSGSFQADTDLSLSLSATTVPEGSGLDAGTVLTLVRGAAGWSDARDVVEVFHVRGKYREHLGLGGGDVRRGIPDLFLEPGVYRLEGDGGKDVGPIKVTFSVPAPFEWIDGNDISVITRSKGVTVHWKNAGDQLMMIAARGLDPVTTASGMCLCTARAAAGQFTIPAAFLNNFPVSVDAPGRRFDELILGSLTVKPPTKLEARGLDSGAVFSVYNIRRMVHYR